MDIFMTVLNRHLPSQFKLVKDRLEGKLSQSLVILRYLINFSYKCKVEHYLSRIGFDKVLKKTPVSLKVVRLSFTSVL